MKLVHISDIHIHEEPILGREPIAQFEAVLYHVGKFHSDADRIVITGDLTHYGAAQAYDKLQSLLRLHPFHGDQAPRLLIGNHDDRTTFLQHFPDAQTDENGFVQWTEDTPVGRFIYMDTVENGHHHGVYCEKRQAWLASQLARARADGIAVFLFMHHNPVKVHVANADLIGIVEVREMQAMLGEYRDIIRHIFFGHCHYTLSGSVMGIPFAAPRSTNHPCWPDFSGDPARMGYGDLKCDYNVCFISDDEIAIHAIDFELEDRVRWMVTGADGWVEKEKVQ